MHPAESGVVEEDRDHRDRPQAVEARLITHLWRRTPGGKRVGTPSNFEVGEPIECGVLENVSH